MGKLGTRIRERGLGIKEPPCVPLTGHEDRAGGGA